LIIGFRERQGHLITDTQQCEVLIPAVGKRLVEFAKLISALSIRDKIPQVEVAAGDNVCAVIIRHLLDFSSQDLLKIEEFGRIHQLQIYLQRAGIDSIRLFYSPVNENLYYRLPRYDLRLEFQAWQFIQINAQVNQAMVDKALELLDCQRDDNILDLFCGIGNFTLPIAKLCSQVTGVEGDKSAVLQAIHNAKINGISHCRFFEADLFNPPFHAEWAEQRFNKILIDPPRTGALHIIEYLEKWRPNRIVYVSCDLATLARDSAKLVEQGYQLLKTGIMDMFPHTQHVEAIALFVKD
jgi:23S rRNA (uracil1939-C5)-methyltransferase